MEFFHSPSCNIAQQYYQWVSHQAINSFYFYLAVLINPTPTSNPKDIWVVEQHQNNNINDL